MSIILQSLGVTMQLFPEVDRKKTILNAKNFLKIQLPKMMIQARVSSLSLKSPVISDMPSGSSHGNSNEIKYINMLQRQNDVQDVLNAIKATKHLEQHILNAVYLEGKADWIVADEIDYSHARYQELKNQALIDFACSLDVYGVHITVYEKSDFYQ